MKIPILVTTVKCDDNNDVYEEMFGRLHLLGRLPRFRDKEDAIKELLYDRILDNLVNCGTVIWELPLA